MAHPQAYRFKTLVLARIADRIPSEYWPEMDELIEDLGLEMVGTF